MTGWATVQRGLLTLAVAVAVFALVYRLGIVMATRSTGRRHYRRMLILYQAAGSSRRASWLWQVTLAPALLMLSRLRIAATRWLSRIPHWANRRVLGSSTGIANQDLVRIRLGGIGMAVLGGLAANGNLVVIVGGGIVGAAVPVFLARRRNRRRGLVFAQQLPQVLSVMITALRAGRSLAQTIDVIAEQVPEPARGEFMMVALQRRVGVDLSDALKQLAERLDNVDLHLLVNAVVVQRETGGNLVPILQTIYTTVRERLTFHGEIRTLTAQVRMTARIITALPFVMFAALFLINPTGISFFWTNRPLGPAMAGGALALIAVGNVIMGRMIVVD